MGYPGSDVFDGAQEAVTSLFQGVIKQIVQARGDQPDVLAAGLLVMFIAGAYSVLAAPEWAMQVLRELRDTGAVPQATLDKIVRDFIEAVPIAAVA